MTTLENRYRRLLSWYPADHRSRFGEEMLGVLMEGARPEQQRPRLGETFDLMRNAVWKRVGQTRESTADGSPWAKAGAVVGLLASMLLLAIQLRADASGFFFARWALPDFRSTPHLTLAAIWLVATLAVLSRWRGIAIGVVWLAVLAEIWVSYVNAPTTSEMVYQYENIVMGLTAAIGLSIAGTAQYGLRLLGPWRTAVAASVSLLVIGSGIVAVFWGKQSAREVNPIWLDTSTLLVGSVLFIATVWRLGGPIRRRALVMGMPAMAVHFFFFTYAYMIAGDILAITVDQTVILPFVVLALSLAALWVRERFQLVRKAPPSTGTDSPVK